MVCVKLAILVPVVVLLFVGVKEAKNSITPTSTHKSTGSTPPSIAPTGNASLSTHPVFTVTSPHFGSMVQRLAIVTAVITSIVGFYFIVKFCRSGKRKARKYGVVKTPRDHETHPLDSDYEDDDEDVTMFDRKN